MVKYIVAEYTCYSKFRVPDDIDLEKVKWWIKHNTLHIELPNGDVLEIESEYEIEGDYKYPNKTEIEEEEE